MSDDSSRERGGSAGSHLLHLISRNAPRLIGAAWVVAEAAARRVADVIQAARAEAEPRRTPERSEPEEAASAREAPEPEPCPTEPKHKGQTATRKKKSSKKAAPPPKPEKRAAAKKPPEKKRKARNRTAKKSKG